MKTKSNLLLFLVITTILLTNSVTSGNAFADNNDDKKNKKTFEQMCAKKKGNEPDALFCRAILGLQHTTDSFFDVFTELRLVDTHLQNQIDSFFDIFVELDDVADKQCPQGQVATGTNLDGSLLCTDMTQNQDCDDGYYVSGIDDNGQIKCKPLPSGSSLSCGDGTLTPPEQCDDGNTDSGDGCSATCSVEEAQCTNGQSLPGSCLTGNVGICQFGTNSCINGQIICSPTVYPGSSAEICSDVLDNDCDGQVDELACTSSTNTCGDGTVTAPETCDDNNVTPGDGCDTACQVETGFSCDGNPSTCSAVCGDGMIAGTEQCDGTDFGGLTCGDFGPPLGSLRCTSSCTIITNSCYGIPL